MKVQQIQSTNINFASKKHVPENLRKGIANLKAKMEHETVMSETKEQNTKTIVRGININNEAVFKDGKFLAKRNLKHQLVPYGKDTSMIEFDDVRLITRDNGEIIEYNKPFFTTWTSVFEKAEKFVDYAVKNYSNKNAIQKQTKTQVKVTPQEQLKILFAYQKLMNTFEKINPWK